MTNTTTDVACGCGVTAARAANGSLPGWFYLATAGEHLCPACLATTLAHAGNTFDHGTEATT